MQRLKTALSCALLASFAALGVCLCLMVRRATAVITALPTVVERNIREQGEATRQAALSAIADTRREALAEIGRTRRDVLARVDRLTDVSAGAVADLTDRTDAQLNALNRTVAENLGRVTGAAQPVLDNAGQVAGQVNDALPLFLDCDHNADCVFNRYVGTMRGIERMSQAVGASAPGTAQAAERIARNVDGITGNVQRVTDDFVKPKGWYRHAIDAVLSFAGIARFFK